MKPASATLIGYGAIGSAVFARLRAASTVRIAHVVVSPASVSRVQQAVGPGVSVLSAVPTDSSLVVECAGHSALRQHVVPALQRGVECAVLSVGALAEAALAEELEAAARMGSTQLHLLAGAVGGIDALSSAQKSELREVVYTGRKPPSGWRGSLAETRVDLQNLQEATVFFSGTAREAARDFPKNANVAATIALAGLGLDATRVQLIADPQVTQNIHEVLVRGDFGEMQLRMQGEPLPENPRTSTLTVLSALRFLHNRTAPVTI